MSPLVTSCNLTTLLLLAVSTTLIPAWVDTQIGRGSEGERGSSHCCSLYKANVRPSAVAEGGKRLAAVNNSSAAVLAMLTQREIVNHMLLTVHIA